jgi:(p)ppGpp synthase/HD superfamily hydrolase
MSKKQSSADTDKKTPKKRIATASNSKLDTNSSGGKVIIGGLPPKKPFELNKRGGQSAEEQCREDEHVQEALANGSAGPQVALQLTHRFTRAVDYARQLHIECRKGTQVPYMAHLLGVAALVLGENGHASFPVTEDVVIAALLHDAMEDHGGSPRLENIRANFGSEVARMVEGCSDSTSEDPAEKVCWEQRKKDYLARLRNEQLDTQLISQRN